MFTDCCCVFALSTYTSRYCAINSNTVSVYLLLCLVVFKAVVSAYRIPISDVVLDCVVFVLHVLCYVMLWLLFKYNLLASIRWG